MNQTSDAIQLVIRVLRADADASSLAESFAGVDGESVAVAALVFGLAPLLHWRLAQFNVGLSIRALAKLIAAREMARTQQRALDRQLDTVLASLNSRGIIPILLKGAHLARTVYPEDGLRQMSDIDLLIPPDELPRVEDAIRALGYVAAYKSPQVGARVTKHTVTFRPPRADDETPNPYLSAAEGRTVEPHISLEESWYGLCADVTNGVRARSVPLRIGSHDARILCADDLVLHLSTHLTFHLIMSYPSLVQLTDLLFVTQRLRDEIHWADIAARARDDRVAPFVYAGLRAANQILAAPIPHEALEALACQCSPGLRAYAGQITLANILARTQRSPVTTFSQRISRGWQERAEAARWAPTLIDRWRVWQTMLDLAHTDTGQLISQRLCNAFVRG